MPINIGIMIYNQIILEDSGRAWKTDIGLGAGVTARGNQRDKNKAEEMWRTHAIDMFLHPGNKVKKSEDRNIPSYPLFTVKPANSTADTGVVAMNGHLYKPAGSSANKDSNFLGWLMENWGKSEVVNPGEVKYFNANSGMIMPRNIDDPRDGARYNRERKNAISLKIWQIVWLLKNNACTIAVKRGMSYGNQAKRISEIPFIRGLLHKLWNHIKSDSSIVNTVAGSYKERRETVNSINEAMTYLNEILAALKSVFFENFTNFTNNIAADVTKFKQWADTTRTEPGYYIRNKDIDTRLTVIEPNVKNSHNLGLIMKMPVKSHGALTGAYHSAAKVDVGANISAVRHLINDLDAYTTNDKASYFEIPFAEFFQRMVDIYLNISNFLNRDAQIANDFQTTADFIESLVNVTASRDDLISGLSMLDDPDLVMKYLSKIFPKYDEHTIRGLAQFNPTDLVAAIASLLLIDKGYVNENYDASKPFDKSMFGSNGDFNAKWNELQKGYFNNPKRQQDEMANYIALITDQLLNKLPPPASIFKDEIKGENNLSVIKVSQPQLDKYLPAALAPNELAELIKPFDHFIVHKNAGSSTFSAGISSSALETKYKTVYSYIITDSIDTIATKYPMQQSIDLNNYAINQLKENPNKYGLADNTTLINLLDEIAKVPSKKIPPEQKKKQIAKLRRDIYVIYGSPINKIISELWFNYIDVYAGQYDCPVFNNHNINLLSSDNHARNEILDQNLEHYYKAKVISASANQNTETTRIAPYIEAFKRERNNIMALANKYTGFISVDQYVNAILNKEDEYLLSEDYFLTYVDKILNSTSYDTFRKEKPKSDLPEDQTLDDPEEEAEYRVNSKAAKIQHLDQVLKEVERYRNALKELITFVFDSIKNEKDTHSNIFNLEGTIEQFKKSKPKAYELALQYVKMKSTKELADMFRAKDEGKYQDDEYFYSDGKESTLNQKAFNSLVNFVYSKNSSAGFKLTIDNNVVRNVGHVINDVANGSGTFSRPKVAIFFGGIAECIRTGEYNRVDEFTDSTRYTIEGENGKRKETLRTYNANETALYLLETLLSKDKTSKDRSFMQDKIEQFKKNIKSDDDVRAFSKIINALIKGKNQLNNSNSLEITREKNAAKIAAASEEAAANDKEAAADSKETLAENFINAFVNSKDINKDMLVLIDLLNKAYQKNVDNPVKPKTAFSIHKDMSSADAMCAAILTIGVKGKDEDGSDICGIDDEKRSKLSNHFFIRIMGDYIKEIKDSWQKPEYSELHRYILDARQKIGEAWFDAVYNKLAQSYNVVERNHTTKKGEGYFLGTVKVDNDIDGPWRIPEGTLFRDVLDPTINVYLRIAEIYAGVNYLENIINDLRDDISSIDDYVDQLPTVDQLPSINELLSKKKKD